jgi:hypothetical protein
MRTGFMRMPLEVEGGTKALDDGPSRRAFKEKN